MEKITTFVESGEGAPRSDMPMVERDAITAVVRNQKTGEILGLRWQKVDWDTLITGGIEEGQTAEQAARAEVAEETGYSDLRLIGELPRYDAKFYHVPKGENRHAKFQCFLFEIGDTQQAQPGADELAKHKPVWLDAEQLANFRLPEGHRFLIDYIQEHEM